MKHKLLPFLFLLSFACEGQIKIGDITISDSLAKEYFLDCQKNPVIKYYAICYYPMQPGFFQGEPPQPQWEEITKAEYGEYAKNKYCSVKIKSNPRTPSASDFAAFMRRKYKNP